MIQIEKLNLDGGAFMKFKRLEITLMLTLAMLFTYAAAVSHEQNEIANGLLRLHVVANSDSAHDQQIKLIIRDEVLEFCAPLLGGAQNLTEVQARLCPHMQELANHIQQTLWQMGQQEKVSVRLAEEYYPTRDYETFSLPAGAYPGLRITIGEGKGHNWWCVVFPALCTEAAAGQAKPSEQQELTPNYTLKFKTAELIGELRHHFSGK